MFWAQNTKAFAAPRRGRLIDLLTLRSSMKLSLEIKERQAVSLLTSAFATVSQ